MWTDLAVSDGSTMRAWVARPDGAEPHAGLLVLQEAFGVNAHIQDVAGRFAARGFIAIAPELFHRTAPGLDAPYGDFPAVMPHVRAMTPDGMAADLRAAFDWLTGPAQVGRSRVAAVGYCMGGRAAFLANATLPLACAVSYYGSGIVPALADRVPALSGPQLFFWGGRDDHIPPEQYRAVDDALRAADRPHVSVVFSEAGHAFFCDARSAYHPAAARESWALTLAFLQDHLSQG